MNSNRRPVWQLLVVMSDDSRRRGDILVREVDYLLGQLQFRVRDEAGLGSLFDSQRGPIAHLVSTAEHVAAEVQLARDGATTVRTVLADCYACGLHEAQGDGSQKQALHLLLVLSALGAHLSSLARQLGELHGRFEQVVKYSIPDHPAPAIRGLRDSTLVDRYLAEAARQFYRDIVLFCSIAKGIGAPYPYDVVPRVYLTRVYDPDSSYFRFASTKAHTAWVHWSGALERAEREQDTNVPPKIGDASSPPDAFVSVRMPFWLPDNLELVPVLGHELGHAALRDCIGSVMATNWLGSAPSHLLGLLKDMATVLARHVLGEGEAYYRAWAEEFMSDLLGFARFRHAYLFSLVTSTLSNGQIRGFAQDSYDESRILVLLEAAKRAGKSGAATAGRTISQVSFFERLEIGGAFRSANSGDAKASLLHVARLAVLAMIGDRTTAVGGSAASQQDASDLCESVILCAQMLRDALAGVQTGVSYDGLVADLVDVLSNGYSGGWNYCEHLNEYWYNSGGRAIADRGFPEFPSYPPERADYFLWRQRVSTELVEEWNATRAAQGSQTPPMVELSAGDQLTDVAWRTRWAEASEQFARVVSRKQPYSLVLRPQIRRLIDDYLFRTTNPRPLFELLNRRALSSGAPATFDECFPKAAPSKTNSLIAYEHFHGVFLPSLKIQSYLRSGKAPPVGSGLVFPQWNRAELFGPLGQNPTPQLLGHFPTRSWVLSLFVTRAGKNQLPRRTSRPAAHSTTLLLGRYDQARLEVASESEARYPVPNKAPYPTLVGRRCLVGVANRTPPRLEDVVAMHLVALSTPLAWRVFHIWVDNVLRPLVAAAGLAVDVLLSDGWEQAVVFVSSPVPNTGAAAQVGAPGTALDALCNALERISSHPLVGRTETMFTPAVFSLTEGTDFDVSIRFRCRAKTGTGLNASVIQNGLLTYDDGRNGQLAARCKARVELRVRTVSGLTDYEVRVRREDAEPVGDPTYLQLCGAIRDAINDGLANHVERLTTQIAFRRRPSSVSVPNGTTVLPADEPSLHFVYEA